MIAALAWIAIIKAGYAGALPALMAEIFPTQIRGTGMSLAYNVAVTIFRRLLAAHQFIADTGDRKQSVAGLLHDDDRRSEYRHR